MLVAALLSGVFFALGWAVQGLVLPRPTRADEVAARAAGWMLRHQFVVSSFRLNGGPPIRGRCLQHWFPTSTGASDRGTLLELSSGVILAGIHPSQLTVRHAGAPEPFPLRLAQLELAGCPSTLASQLAQPIQAGRPLHLSDDGAELAVVVPTPRATLTVFVDRHTDTPIAIVLRSRHFHGFSRIHLAPVDARMLRALQQTRVAATPAPDSEPASPRQFSP